MNGFYGERATELILAYLKHLKQGHGVERLYLAAFSCHNFIGRVISVGFTDVEFLDLQADSGEVDLSRIERGQVKTCLLYTHSLGSEFTPHEAIAALKSAGIIDYAIDDRCLCNPLLYDGNMGPFDAVFFSFGASKQLPLGHGGLMVLAKPHEAAFSQRFHLTELNALLDTGKDWDQHMELREATHRKFQQALGKWAISTAKWRFSILCDDSAGLEARIFSHGLFCSRHYRHGYTDRLAASAHFASHVVNFFVAGEYSDRQVDEVIELVQSHLAP